MAEVIHPNAAKVLAAAKKYADEKYTEGTNNDTIFGKRYVYSSMMKNGEWRLQGIKMINRLHLIAWLKYQQN